MLNKITIALKRKVLKTPNPGNIAPPYSYSHLIKNLKQDADVKFCCYKDYEFIKNGVKFLFNKQAIAKYKNIFIRHDVDHNPYIALKMAETEAGLGIQSTYYFLTTDTFSAKRYWTKKQKQYLRYVKLIQDFGHETGLHYDFFGDYYSKGISPENNLSLLLDTFRQYDIKIYGCASHGSATMQDLLKKDNKYKSVRQFVNYSVWKEVCRNSGSYTLNGKRLTIPCLSLYDNNLKYEAYFVHRDYYSSDSRGKFWQNGNPLDTLQLMKTGEVFSLLIHPIWWRNYLK